MPSSEPILTAPQTLPLGYFAAPLFPDHRTAPLRISVIVRKEPDPVAGHFVILRTLLDAVVYLGCITDSGDRLHGYVEIWVQSLAGLANSPSAAREALSNRTLDDRWARLYKACDALDDQFSGSLLRTGYETKPIRPLFYDTEKREMTHPIDAFSNAPWSLCTDDAKLTAKNLPPYSSSLHRYLIAEDKSPLVPLTEGASANAKTAPLSEIAGPKQSLRPYNPGGLMLVRQYAPVALEPFFDLLSGAPWQGILAGRTALHLDHLNEALEEKSGSSSDMADGRLFLGKHGKWGRLTETFHLKLRLLADVVANVRALTAQTQRPLLNISAQSFQIRIGAGAHAYALPFLWTASANLVDPGDAVTLKIEGADVQYFLRGLSAPGNVYQPDSISRPAAGRGTLRIRKTMNDASGMIVEGTFATHDRLGSASSTGEPSKNDLVWLRTPIGSCSRLDLFGHVEKEPALAAGEWALPHRTPEILGCRLGPA